MTNEVESLDQYMRGVDRMLASPLSTLECGQDPAAICRARGWTVGTQLVGDEGFGPETIEITAIGRRNILAITIARKGRRVLEGREGNWNLTCRDWHVVRYGPPL